MCQPCQVNNSKTEFLRFVVTLIDDLMLPGMCYLHENPLCKEVWQLACHAKSEPGSQAIWRNKSLYKRIPWCYIGTTRILPQLFSAVCQFVVMCFIVEACRWPKPVRTRSLDWKKRTLLLKQIFEMELFFLLSFVGAWATFKIKYLDSFAQALLVICLTESYDRHLLQQLGASVISVDFCTLTEALQNQCL